MARTKRGGRVLWHCGIGSFVLFFLAWWGERSKDRDDMPKDMGRRRGTGAAEPGSLGGAAHRYWERALTRNRAGSVARTGNGWCDGNRLASGRGMPEGCRSGRREGKTGPWDMRPGLDSSLDQTKGKVWSPLEHVIWGCGWVSMRMQGPIRGKLHQLPVDSACS